MMVTCVFSPEVVPGFFRRSAALLGLGSASLECFLEAGDLGKIKVHKAFVHGEKFAMHACNLAHCKVALDGGVLFRTIWWALPGQRITTFDDPTTPEFRPPPARHAQIP